MATLKLAAVAALGFRTHDAGSTTKAIAHDKEQALRFMTLFKARKPH